MVGAQDIGDALMKAGPDPVAMAGIAHRWIHLQLGADGGIEAGIEREVVRRDFDARHILVVAQEVDLLARRDMQHMDDGTLGTGNAHEALGALERSDLVAPDRVGAWVALHADVLALLEAIFVLGMEGRATAGLGKDRRHARVVLDEQGAGRGSHEDLDAGSSRQPLQLGNVLGILVGAADPEGEIAMHPVMAARHLVGERLGRGRQRIGVGHFEDGRDAPQNRRAGASLKIFLVDQAWLAKMHLTVDDTGQDVEARAVDDLPG